MSQLSIGAVPRVAMAKISLSPLAEVTAESLQEKPGMPINVFANPDEFPPNLLRNMAESNILIQTQRESEGASLPILNALMSRRRGTTEFTLISRTDALGELIIAGSAGGKEPLDSDRNRTTDSTIGRTRPDAFYFFPGLPLIVLIEEKDGHSTSHRIDDAVRDLVEKFELTPAYGTLRYIIGIAVAGDTIQIVRLSGARTHEVLATFNFTDVSHRIQCIVAMLNIGRWCKSVGSRPGALYSTPYQYGKLYRDDKGRREITVGFRSVHKTYLNLLAARENDLRAFYKAIAGVPFVERAVKMDREDSKSDVGGERFSVELVPVGLAMSADGPETMNDVVMAFACMVHALFQIHAKGWCVMDLRWPNIVRFRESSTGKGYRFYIIDCEYATRIGDAVPSVIQHHFSSLASAAVSSKHDWHMLAAMARRVNQRSSMNDRRLQNFADFMSRSAADAAIGDIQRQSIFSGFNWDEL
jgi:hypothetical protein